MHSGRRKSKSGAGNYLEQNNAWDYNKIYYANMEELSMKNGMAKRVLCLLLSAAVLFGGVTECNAAALGETTEVAETEEETFASLSDVEKNATVLSFGKKVTGKLTSCTAENWYKFTSKANGYF